MSVRVIAELHPIRRTRVKITTSAKPIAEIIKDLNSWLPLSQARVCRNGEIVKDFSLMANDGDFLTIKFVPYGSTNGAGVGMKLAGWALTIAGVLLIETGFGAALIGAGVGLLVGGTALLNINIPKMKDMEKPENDPSIRGAKNQSRPYGRIPVLFGRHRLYPDLAANPFSSIDGNQQYYTQLFCGGYKDCVIDKSSFKLGETSLVDLSQTKNIDQILFGADPIIRLEILQNGEASNLYPYCVHEDVINATIQNKIEDANGNKISGAIERNTPDNTNEINVDIFFYNGLGKYNDEGELESASVEVKASYKPFNSSNSAYELLGYFKNNTNTMSGSELKTKRYQVTKSGLTPGQYTVKIERITADNTDSKIIDQVYVGSIRSIKSKDIDGKAVRPIRAERQKDLTIIALRVMATGKLNNILDSFNYIATAKLPVFSGGGSGALYWPSATETRNPASALLYALQGRAAQQRVDNGDIDWASLEAFYTWCAQKNYFCDAYLAEPASIAEMMRMIGGTARADILRIDSKISVVQDIERPSHTQLFTPKNSISYSVTMLCPDIPDAIAMRFIDSSAGYAQNECTVYNTPDGNPPAKSPETTQKIDLWGITDSAQARRIGMYNYACLKNRPFVHTIEADIEYMVCNKGDWIQYAGDIALAGSAQGRIKGVIWVDDVCIGIDTDEPIVMTDGKQHAVRIRLSNGTIILRDVVFNLGILREKAISYRPGEGEELYEPFIDELRAVDEDNEYYEPQNVIYFTEPLTEADAPKAGDIYAFGVRGYEALDLIITDIQPGQNLTAVLTCVEYAPEIFGVDKDGFVLPAFENKITPVSGAVDSGVVNPDRWRSFAVYHDSDEEPARPSGDGQEGGWHFIQTFRSVWQSSKVAESIESGEWGLPVRIKAERGLEDVTPIWLTLSPQNITLDTDQDGNLIVGLLPLTVQARLLKWNSVLTGVTFSLAGAPSGVSIDSNGLITVAANADLGAKNNITVRAAYQGGTYSATLTIEKNVNNGLTRYLGTVKELTISDAAVTIIKGRVTGNVKAKQGDFVLTVAAAGGRPFGSVFQWGGAAWEYRSPDTHLDLYMQCFRDGLDEPNIANSVEWFGSIFARKIVALQAFIEELQAQVITLKEQGLIKSENYKPGVSGFLLPANGKATFNEETHFNNLKVVSFEIIPPTSEGILIENLIGYQSKSISLSIGWYAVEMAGGGGGKGADYKGNGGNGGAGGYLRHLFYNQYNNITASLISGNGGNGGRIGENYNYNQAGGGGGGAGSILEVLNLNLTLFAGGGGGGGGGQGVYAGNYIGGGGGGGGIGKGGNGGAAGGGGGGQGDTIRVGGSGSGSSEAKGGIGYDNVGGNGGNGANSFSSNGNDGYVGGTSINGVIVSNVGGGNNANGGAGYLRLYKLS